MENAQRVGTDIFATAPLRHLQALLVKKVSKLYYRPAVKHSDSQISCLLLLPISILITELRLISFGGLIYQCVCFIVLLVLQLFAKLVGPFKILKFKRYD